MAAFLPAPIVLVQGCGAGVAECTIDADCDQGFACELSECVLQCNSDDECAEDEVCLRGLTTQRRVCGIDDGNSSSGIETSYALIRDTTEGDGCATGEPGADIAFVLIEDLDGGIVAWGRVLDGELGEEESDYTSWAHLNGARPADGADSCPALDENSVVALGCSGYLVVEFVDTNGAPVTARSGEHLLRVGEYGAQCDGGTDSDRYEVLSCPGVENMDDLPQSCTVSVGVGTGERAFEI